MKKVIIYTKDDCPFCDDAKRYFERLENVELDIRNIFEKQEWKVEWLRLVTENNLDRAVPVIVIGKHILQTFSVQEALRALNCDEETHESNRVWDDSIIGDNGGGDTVRPTSD